MKSVSYLKAGVFNTAPEGTFPTELISKEPEDFD